MYARVCMHVFLSVCISIETTVVFLVFNEYYLKHLVYLILLKCESKCIKL